MTGKGAVKRVIGNKKISWYKGRTSELLHYFIYSIGAFEAGVAN